MQVRRHQSDDPLPQIILSAVPFDRLNQNCHERVAVKILPGLATAKNSQSLSKNRDPVRVPGGNASVDPATRQVAVRIDAAVSQEWPMRSHFVT
jgi:hypothetical protein